MARPPCCLLAELAAEADRERMDLGAEAGGRAQGAKLKGNFLLLCCLPCSLSPVVLQKAASELHPKVRNHGEGPYWGLLLVESGYYRFHI